MSRSRIYLNYTPIKFDVFPGGEVYLRSTHFLSRDRRSASIRAYLYDANGIMALLLLNDALIREGGLLTTVFKDDKLTRETTSSEIRKCLHGWDDSVPNL